MSFCRLLRRAFSTAATTSQPKPTTAKSIRAISADLANVKRFRVIDEIVEDQKKYPDFSDEDFTVRIISLYGKAGMFDNAGKVYDEMPQRNCERTVLSFNVLLGACVNSKKFDMVEKIFRDVPEKLSIEPDLVSYNTVIKASCKISN
ncbi:small ribosomal subunit protein mS79 (rPPR3b)-like [Rosa rugosa]|uniref:small ribosomal subunit protein mS79 (rPPR3b)-like n=1 Tax=Rosa rugosa TaxID=74645 RepID=UPI002B412198|nr:small ribosomal subunit protein mS79 (rPPR3b)-like [Rosa rugosa]